MKILCNKSILNRLSRSNSSIPFYTWLPSVYFFPTFLPSLMIPWKSWVVQKFWCPAESWLVIMNSESKWIRYSYIRNSPTQIIWTKLRPGDDQMTMADQSLGSSQAANFEMYHFFWEYQDFLKKIQVATLTRPKKWNFIQNFYTYQMFKRKKRRLWHIADSGWISNGTPRH